MNQANLKSEWQSEVSVDKTHRDSFSKASHFALALVPVLLAFSSFVILDCFTARAEVMDTLFHGAMKIPLLQDKSALFHLFTLVMFIGGVGFSMQLLRWVYQLEQWEKKNKNQK